MSQESDQPSSPTQTSLPNTTPDSQKRIDDFSVIIRTARPTKVDESNAALEQQLQREKDERREERFIWIFVAVMLFDVLAVEKMSYAVVLLFLLQLVFLSFVGKWLGIEAVAVPLERLFDRIMRWLPESSDSSPKK
jgi:hypothetical protein